MKLIAVVCLASAVALGCSDDDDNQQLPADSSVPDTAAADITVTGSCLPKGKAINCYPASSGGKAVAWTATGNKKVIGTRWACEFSKSAGGTGEWFYYGNYNPPNNTGAVRDKETLEKVSGGTLCSRFTSCPQPVGTVNCISGQVIGSQKSPVLRWTESGCVGLRVVGENKPANQKDVDIRFGREHCTDPAGKKL